MCQLTNLWSGRVGGSVPRSHRSARAAQLNRQAPYKRMRYLFAILITTLLSTVACSRSVPAVRDGDVIFQTSQSSQSVAIQRATHSPYSHMGIIFVRAGQPY